MWFSLKDSHLQLMIVFGFALSGVFCGHDDGDIDDECIWEDRNYRENNPPSVMNAQTECLKGKLIWHHPYGGFRMSFHPSQIKGPFKLCFTSQDSGISIFQEGVKDLTLLRASKDHKSHKRICLPTSKTHIVLYIEASEKDEKAMEIVYSITPLKKRHHKLKACKPCRYDKLIKLICKSDIAVRGYINSSFTIPNTHFVQADFVAQDLIRQKHHIFAKSPHQESKNYIKGLVRLPSGCSWGKGKRNLILMTGDIVSGEGAVMNCFTRDKEWLKLKKEYFKHLCNIFI